MASLWQFDPWNFACFGELDLLTVASSHSIASARRSSDAETIGKTKRDIPPSNTKRRTRQKLHAQPAIQPAVSAATASNSQKRLSNSSMLVQLQRTAHFIRPQTWLFTARSFGNRKLLRSRSERCIPFRANALERGMCFLQTRALPVAIQKSP